MNCPNSNSSFGPEAVVRLRVAFERTPHPMLIADNQRRWVTGNDAAAELLGISRVEIPWHGMDDFTPSTERQRLQNGWGVLLAANGEAEGRGELYLANRGSVPIEFSATANVQPGRHLSVVIPLCAHPFEMAKDASDPDATWTRLWAEERRMVELTEREREVVTLVASGLQSAVIAERLFVSSETVKSHVQNAMRKLGVHTRAHAVAVALVTGQITWDL
ncbi:MAG: hypothetical protein QOG62_2315 [Thermoleophilaceae bacterium]|jgi:PAS domain S-box-containing protein|nr:hypothetical protein [Thermoleophilaceae bacterium]